VPSRRERDEIERGGNKAEDRIKGECGVVVNYCFFSGLGPYLLGLIYHAGNGHTRE
jgi:hypothetical protein